MRYTLAVATLVLFPVSASAQTGDVGVNFALAYRQYLDVENDCCPASVWVTLGSGRRFRLHVDYLRSHRLDRGSGSYPHDQLIDGRSASTLHDSIEEESMHEVNVLVAWRAIVRRDFEVLLLFGGSSRRSLRNDCTAFDGPSVRIPTPSDYPSDHIVFHTKLTDADLQRCAERRYDLRWIVPQAGVAIDWPIGSRYFIRADARLSLLRLGFGAGVRF